MMKNVSYLMPTLLVLAGSPVSSQPPSPYFDFKGKHLLVLSDADMLASAYVTGEAGPKTASLRDVLTLIPVGEGTEKSSS